jgi:hypothetical protein
MENFKFFGQYERLGGWPEGRDVYCEQVQPGPMYSSNGSITAMQIRSGGEQTNGWRKTVSNVH